MIYGIVLPADTQRSIERFIEARCRTLDTALSAQAAIKQATEYVATNPTIGAVPYGGPLESRRVYRFLVPVGEGASVVVEFMYAIRSVTKNIVFSGFAEPDVTLPE